MRENQAISYQLSAFSQAGPAFIRAFVRTFALVFLFAISTFASDNCSHKVWNWKVDKKAALELQRFVNEGHEPWRMDDTATIAGQAIEEHKKEWGDYQHSSR
ncbi:MAG: hypothetical protein WBM04_02650 [Candidatus Korobacteraceae bacterium]